MGILIYWVFTVSGFLMMYMGLEAHSFLMSASLAVIGFLVIIGAQQLDIRKMEEQNEVR